MFQYLYRLGISLRNWSSEHHFWIVSAAVLFFFAGIVWSVVTLQINWNLINYSALAAAILVVPISMIFNAYELVLCANATGGEMRLRRALAFSSTATVANVLPIPASALVRGGALMSAGASVAMSGKIILIAGLLWLTMASSLTALAVLPKPFEIIAFLAGLAVCFGLVIWVKSISNGRIAVQFLTVRMTLIILLMIRLFLFFLTINAGIALIDTAVFSVVGIVGNAVAIIPAGIGVTESLGALLAPASAVAPAAAFLVLALNRLTGLMGAGLVSIFLFAEMPRESRTEIV